MISEDYKKFESSLGVEFNDKSLLQIVFTHRSYLNEHRGSKLTHNERLEFLGDAVLELCTTEYLYKKLARPEGEMTNLRSAMVKGESLSEEAKRLGMNDLIKTSRGESKNTGKARDLILANAFEALIGAIYIDKGYKEVYKFIEINIVYKLDDIVKEGLWYDPKSRFQEMAQESIGITPSYDTLSDTGPDHNKIFEMGAYIERDLVGKGSGQSKQKAQSEAAKDALSRWEEILKKYS
ncbi:ribonuclease III [Candidatus Berkelbacteria bacterium RIFOXYA2_FULL_43_10]|uniref:Ribonuclease 3 n=1 Tax=Candidatus Berkelbacteria bacterium RIFOXYA2_FULL_43_10 TaxID=1797472 RepID=A0A1F5EFG8_9BACT|nr:MAG: ribonuclease III [Candidatus Berkelbacteria bacterium RIFOXYA2_FULL_43_10]